MAGDWMKIELELPDKPEVHAIAARLQLDPDAVVGKLIRVWQWFDKHTVDGNADGVTFALPDRISGVSGFGEAMNVSGWLEQKDNMLVMPNFDRHTSASAKQRALTAKRVAKSKGKSNAEGNAKTVTTPVSGALPREEKRKEDINTTLPTRAGELCKRLRKIGIDVAPHQVQLLDILPRFTDEQIIAVAELAVSKKPGERISVGYLVPMLEDKGRSTKSPKPDNFSDKDYGKEIVPI